MLLFIFEKIKPPRFLKRRGLKNNDKMKIQTAIRLDKDLLELAKAEAKNQKRSLNNYIEYLLHKDVGNVPNVETKRAI